MKRTSILSLAALPMAAMLMLAPVARAQDPLNDPVYAGKDKEQLRTLNGNVRDKSETGLPGSIVYLKNMKTLAVKTYIADNEAAFHFHSLSPNVDYEVYAEFNGQRSATKMLSSFDSRPVVNMELKIDAKK